jgi:homoserine O-succinyltransferase
MTHHALPPRPAPDRPLVIAVINNMPDSALRATERHYCQLLGRASAGMTVDLRFYSVPAIARGASECAHIAEYYDDFAKLAATRPDGLIVTGAEPKFASLEQEAFWPALCAIADWTEGSATPVIWSCLAAHAAIHHADGIERQRLGAKLSGVFKCAITRKPHQILHGLPSSWRVPHSRLHGIRRRDLEANGYTVLSQSRRVGVDMFMRNSSAMQLYFQGHPEYDPATLLLEYRRDLLRTKQRAAHKPPAMPHGLWGRAEYGRKGNEIAALYRNVEQPALAAHVGEMAQRIGPAGNWSGPAQKIYANWLAYLHAHRNGRMRASAGGAGAPYSQADAVASVVNA